MLHFVEKHSKSPVLIEYLCAHTVTHTYTYFWKKKTNYSHIYTWPRAGEQLEKLPLYINN
jgi:hypothetical protein